MDSRSVKIMLDKYWEGETTLEEEAQLRAYFNSNEVDKAFEKIQPLFTYFNKEQDAYLNGDFDERLSSRLKAAEKHSPRAHSLTTFLWRAAAVAAIAIGVVWYFNTGNIEDRGSFAQLTQNEQVEARQAYQDAKTALFLISNKLNKGTSKAEDGLIQVRKATKVIRE